MHTSTGFKRGLAISLQSDCDFTGAKKGVPFGTSHSSQLDKKLSDLPSGESQLNPSDINRIATDARFDAGNIGSFPPKLATLSTQELCLHGEDRRGQAKVATSSDSGSELAADLTVSRLGTAPLDDLGIRPSKKLPLELFDNPELEQVQPQERLARVPHGEPGIPARSKFYDTAGNFSWAPCHVLEFLRLVQEAPNYPTAVRIPLDTGAGLA